MELNIRVTRPLDYHFLCLQVLEQDLNKYKNQLVHQSRIAARSVELTSTPTDTTLQCTHHALSPYGLTRMGVTLGVCMCDQLEQFTRGTQLREKTASHSRQRNQRVEQGFMCLKEKETPHPRSD